VEAAPARALPAPTVRPSHRPDRKAYGATIAPLIRRGLRPTSEFAGAVRTPPARRCRICLYGIKAPPALARVAGYAGPAGRGGFLPEPVFGEDRQAALEGGVGDGLDTGLRQHPQAVLLAGRLDDPRQHQLPEHLIALGGLGEPERVVDAHNPSHRCLICEDSICSGPDPAAATAAASKLIARGLRASEIAAGTASGMTIQELATELDVRRTIAYRVLSTLEIERLQQRPDPDPVVPRGVMARSASSGTSSHRRTSGMANLASDATTRAWPRLRP
jgi:hypothetical protein